MKIVIGWLIALFVFNYFFRHISCVCEVLLNECGEDDKLLRNNQLIQEE